VVFNEEHAMILHRSRVSKVGSTVGMMRWILSAIFIGAIGLGFATIARADAPTLVGLDQNKPINLPIKVQAAYNDDTMFFDVEWDGNRGDTHDLARFNGSVWEKQGGSRREAQATIDNDPARGPTNIKSTNYESRITWMLNDPNGPNAVPEFSSIGCFAACHDNSRAMPAWDPSKDLTKYLHIDPEHPNAKLDMWHHRIARANPIGMSDDQKVIQTDGTTGGRKGDGGIGAPYESNKIVDGKPKWVLNNEDTVGGAFAFDFENTHTDPNNAFMRDGDSPPKTVARALDYEEALQRGYVPQEGDTVPYRRLRDLRGTPRGDITALGTTITPTSADAHMAHIESSTQRLLDTGDPDDTALADGHVYDIAFAVHTGMVNMRDHYVSFPMKLALGEAGPADLHAVKIPGSGRDDAARPDFSDLDMFPETNVDLFLPGITSREFLLGEDVGKEYIDPVTNAPVSQTHGGTLGLQNGMTCADCHTPSGTGPFSMANLTPLRGGVWTPSPLQVPEPATIITSLLAVVVGLSLVTWRKRKAD